MLEIFGSDWSFLIDGCGIQVPPDPYEIFVDNDTIRGGDVFVRTMSRSVPGWRWFRSLLLVRSIWW